MRYRLRTVFIVTTVTAAILGITRQSTEVITGFTFVAVIFTVGMLAGLAAWVFSVVVNFFFPPKDD